MQTLEIYVTQVPFLNTSGEELKMHWGTILSSLTPRSSLRGFSTSASSCRPLTRACSLAFCQPVKSCEICLIDMTMQDISCCRAIDLARNEDARGREIFLHSRQNPGPALRTCQYNIYALCKKSNVSTLFPVCNMPVITRIF